jgi:hypothetical protein
MQSEARPRITSKAGASKVDKKEAVEAEGERAIDISRRLLELRILAPWHSTSAKISQNTNKCMVLCGDEECTLMHGAQARHAL